MCDKYTDTIENKDTDEEEKYRPRRRNERGERRQEKSENIQSDHIPNQETSPKKEIPMGRTSQENYINEIVGNRNYLMRTDNKGNTYLHKMAIENSSPEAIQKALDTLKSANSFKSDINRLNVYRHSPLFLSIIARNRTFTLAFLRNEASITQVDYLGKSIFHYLAEGNAEFYAGEIFKDFSFPNEISQVLQIWDYNGVTPIQLAIQEDNMESFHYYYNIGGGLLRQRDKKRGYTLLHMSAEKGNGFLVDFLLNEKDLEIDINEQAPDEATALHLAVSNGHINIVESLLDAGSIATIFLRECSILALIQEDREMEMLKLFATKLNPSEYKFLEENKIEENDTDGDD